MRPSHFPLAAPPLSKSLSHPVGPSSPSLSGHRRSSARRLPRPLLVVTIACRSFSASPATLSASAAWARPRNLPARTFCMRADKLPGSLRRAPANKPPRPSLGLRQSGPPSISPPCPFRCPWLLPRSRHPFWSEPCPSCLDRPPPSSSPLLATTRSTYTTSFVVFASLTSASSLTPILSSTLSLGAHQYPASRTV